MTNNVAKKLAALVRHRAKSRCEYCHAPQRVIGQAYHIEHIVPRSKGGLTALENLALACSHCNFAKSDKTDALDPRMKKRVILFNPRTDQWETHFAWSKDWQRLKGRTATGRATVEALDMNATIVRQARYYWHLLDLIP